MLCTNFRVGLKSAENTVPEPIRATKIVIGNRSPISFWSVIDTSNWSIIPVIASRDHRAVTVFYSFCCFLCQFYTYLHNVIDININLHFQFTYLLFQTKHTSLNIKKSNKIGHQSSVIDPSVINQSMVIDLSNCYCSTCEINLNTVYHYVLFQTVKIDTHEYVTESGKE